MTKTTHIWPAWVQSDAKYSGAAEKKTVSWKRMTVHGGHRWFYPQNHTSKNPHGMSISVCYVCTAYIEEHQRCFRLGSYFMAVVFAATIYYRGGFSLCLAGNVRRVMVAGGSTFHLEPGTIHSWWNLLVPDVLYALRNYRKLNYFRFMIEGGGWCLVL